jgi:hypothetical protein
MKRVLLSAAVLLAAVAVGSSSAGAVTNPNLQVKITADRAVAVARAFAGSLSGSSAIATGPFQAVDRSYFRVENSSFRANVDALDGSIRTIVFLGSVPVSGSSGVDSSAAAAAASDFLSQRGISGGIAPHVLLIDHGSYRQYDVVWQTRLNGALVPDERTVSINPGTGEVFSYENFSRPYETPPTASVTREQAIAAAEAYLKVSEARVAAADLVIAFDLSGAQTLVWRLELGDLAPDGGAALVQVDALDASVQVIGRG